MPEIVQWSQIKSDTLQLAYDDFIIAQRAAQHAPTTIVFYERRLPFIIRFFAEQGVTKPEQITAAHCRALLLGLQTRELSERYIHQHAQIMKTFFRFLYVEGYIIDNVFSRVKMPKVSERILPAFTAEEIKALLGTASTNRDRAIILCLLDSGVRAKEFLALNVGDIDLKSGLLTIQQGKSRKGRFCFLGAKSRKGLIKYLRERDELVPEAPLWLARNGDRFLYWGLSRMLRDLGRRVGVSPCNPHRFRRTFALMSLRAGMDVYSLQKLMGHADLSVLHRYLAQTQDDLQEAHRKAGPVDRWL